MKSGGFGMDKRTLYRKHEGGRAIGAGVRGKKKKGKNEE